MREFWKNRPQKWPLFWSGLAAKIFRLTFRGCSVRSIENIEGRSIAMACLCCLVAGYLAGAMSICWCRMSGSNDSTATTAGEANAGFSVIPSIFPVPVSRWHRMCRANTQSFSWNRKGPAVSMDLLYRRIDDPNRSISVVDKLLQMVQYWLWYSPSGKHLICRSPL